jgi:mannose-6-phosphate isomerase-like protein (cupin superfamily)
MSETAPPQGLVDAVQLFALAAAQGRGDLAASPNSQMTVLRVPPRGEMEIHNQGSDQILVVLRGACEVTGLSTRQELKADQGVLVPPDVTCRISNPGPAELVFLSMQTQRAPGYVVNAPSDVTLRIPTAYLDGKAMGHRIYAYIIDRRTIGFSTHIMEEWNQASALRMHCHFEVDGDEITVTLPERIVRWYQLDDLRDGDYTFRPDRIRTRVRADFTPYITRQLSK